MLGYASANSKHKIPTDSFRTSGTFQKISLEQSLNTKECDIAKFMTTKKILMLSKKPGLWSFLYKMNENAWEPWWVFVLW